MARIYRHAFCTISVNIRESVDRPLWSGCGFTEDLSSTGWVTDYFNSRRWKDSQSIFKGFLERGELGTRGWCLQERQLSPRIFHFMESGMMMWECCCYIGALGGPKQSGPPHSEAKPEGYKTRMVDIDAPLDSDHQIQQTMSNWYHALSDYTTRLLTFESDRPLAIQGLADHVSSITNYQYYHGLWQQDAVRGLLWERRNGKSDSWIQSPLLRESNHSIPSWSWLSIKGPVQICSQNDEDLSPPFMEDTRDTRPIIDHEYRRVSENLRFEFQSNGSKIAITGPVRDVDWTAVRGYAPLLPPHYEQVSIPNGIRIPLETLKQGVQYWQTTKALQHEFAWVTLDFPSERSAIANSYVHVLQLTLTYGILVVKNEQEEYYRIGVVRGYRWKSDDFHLKKITLI